MKLLCPICCEPLTKINHVAACPNNHCFDYARHDAYLNLFLKQSVAHGDNKIMVQARTAFLNTGSYAFLRDELNRQINHLHPETLVDLGCGEGYYTRAFSAPEKYGFDLSKEALKHAGNMDPSTAYVVASIFHLPLPDTCADVAVTCFAPAAMQEIERILKTGGSFLFVTPGPRHLWEMKKILYDMPYENEQKNPETSLQLIKSLCLSDHFTIGKDQILNLFAMTPYAHRTPKESVRRLENVSDLSLTAEFIIRLYQK